MPVGKLTNDATSSTKGTIYQLYVAVQKCFEMRSGQRILIERYGDVTVVGDTQLEIKYHNTPLTDGHVNFWKTLTNWMQDNFDDTPYHSLVLCTTQEIGMNSVFKDWNSSNLQKRISILHQIYRDSQPSKPGARKKPSAVQLLQKWALAKNREGKLHRILERFTIADDSLDMKGLYETIKDQHAKAIPQANKDNFLDALLGFVIRPVVGGSWVITHEEFSKSVEELAALYLSSKKMFPVKYLNASQISAPEIVEATRERLFVKKIQEIEYREVMHEAIEHYLYASETVRRQFASYTTLISHYEQFASEALAYFKPRYRAACLAMVDTIRDSQIFYNQETSSSPPSFPGYDTPRVEFRNGVLHMLADDPEKGLKWRLERK